MYNKFVADAMLEWQCQSKELVEEGAGSERVTQ